MPAAAEPLLAIDTSVAIPLVLGDHEAHDVAVAWRAGRALAVCGHAWLETYAVLTRLPGSARLAPEDAARVLTDHFDTPISPHPVALIEAVEELAAAGIVGGAVYDGWIAITARGAGVRLATRDARAVPTYHRLRTDVEIVPR